MLDYMASYLNDSDMVLTVLVLGVGGNVSQGILKALSHSTLKLRIIGACVSRLGFGLYTVDRAYLSPPASDPLFVEWLIDVCRTERVDAILSGVEPVLYVLSQNARLIQAECDAIAIVSSPDKLAIGNDKFRLCQWLEEHDFHFPRFVAAQDAAAARGLVDLVGYPLIAKPRNGKGAYGLLEVHNDEELAHVVGLPNYVIEEYLGDADHEFTVGCFSDDEGAVRGTIVMRRTLMYGTTVYAEVGDYPDIRAEARRIAEALRPMGPCNVQMRLSHGKAVCFEVNVRFSGTTPMRAHFGFNDVEAALRHYVLGEPAVDLPIITHGRAIRYWNELYISDDAPDQLARDQRLDETTMGNPVIEDYGMRPRQTVFRPALAHNGV